MKDSSSLIFTGDIGFDKYMDQRFNDENLISPSLLSFLHTANHVIINVEGALIEQEKKASVQGISQLIHTMSPQAIKVFDKMHADIWNICNNHILDAGEEGIKSTLSYAAKHHVQTVGAGINLEQAKKPIYLNEAGGIGLFSVGYRRGCKAASMNQAGCYLWHEMEQISQSIKDIKERCNWCIMIVHGGEEFTSLPSPYVRDRYLTYLDMGADIIVAHHPHVPMNYERVGKKIIFYSLGNFIFDTDYQRCQFNTDIGELLKINLDMHNYDFEVKGVKINRQTETIEETKVPVICQNIDAQQYQLLIPLAAKMMISAYKRQLLYLKENEFKYADEKKWAENFMAEKRSGRVPNEALDFRIIYPLAKKAQEGNWQKSNLEEVKEYILKQI